MQESELLELNNLLREKIARLESDLWDKEQLRKVYSEKAFELECRVRELEARNQKDFVWRGEEICRLNDEIDSLREGLEGWQLVPVEPSKEMRSQIHPIADGNCSHCGNRTTLDCEENMLLSWRDMLEAAPKPGV